MFLIACSNSSSIFKNATSTISSNYSAGHHYLTYTCEPTKLLPFLMKKLRSMDVRMVKTKIKDLKKLKDQKFDVVINCTGIGSRELCSDKSVIPVRGQVIRVNNHNSRRIVVCTFRTGF